MTDSATPAVSLICGAVLVSFFDGSHRTHTVFAHVLAVGPVDPETEQPTLTVAFPDPTAAPQKLASVKWYEGYKRICGVQHVSHPDVAAGKVSIAYGGTIGRLADLKGEGPEIPQPAGNGSRPYFERQGPGDAPKVSVGQQETTKARETAEIVAGQASTQPADPQAGNTAPGVAASDPASSIPGTDPTGTSGAQDGIGSAA